LRRVSLSRMQSANRQSRVGRPGCVHSSTLPSGSTIRFSSSMLCFPGRSLTYTGPPLTCVSIEKDCQRTQVHYTARYLAPPDLCLAPVLLMNVMVILALINSVHIHPAGPQTTQVPRGIEDIHLRAVSMTTPRSQGRLRCVLRSFRRLLSLCKTNLSLLHQIMGLYRQHQELMPRGQAHRGAGRPSTDLSMPVHSTTAP